ncbi:MAG TPA: hypothetical protein PKC91_10405 [Ignavibacteria bacterium]|nr:hypothetical protein [Ignavibacteria bacterium]
MNEIIKETLDKAQLHVNKLRKQNSRFIYISLIASVLATLLAGFTAVNGKPLAGQGPGAWSWTCGVVAIFTATATVFTGLHKQFTVPERLAKATECVGKLKSVLISLERSDIKDSDKDALLTEYKRIVEVYSEFIV